MPRRLFADDEPRSSGGQASLSLLGLECIKFTARWCGPCVAIQPTFVALAARHPVIQCYVVDVDDVQDEGLIQEAVVESLPTFVFLRDGREVRRVVGASEGSLRAAFERATLDDGDSEEENEGSEAA
jgi:thioredoxin 1